MFRVHLYREYSPEFMEELSLKLDIEIIVSSGSAIPDPPYYEILVYPTPSKDWIEGSPKLRAIVIPWAGIPPQTRDLMKNYPQISLHNLHHNRYNTAEFGFTLLLAAAKSLIPMDQALRNDDWSLRYSPTSAIALRGKQVLILGYGEIGQALGDYCLGFGMNVTAIRRNPENHAKIPGINIFSMQQLHELLPNTEILIISLPLTEETQDLIGKEEIQLMPDGSLLINIGRGPIVNQFALYNALVSGHLRGAGSDVWYNYPKLKSSRKSTPPADVPFKDLDNFVLSPHRGGMVEEVEKQRALALAALLNAANRGWPIPNKVNVHLGY